MGVCGIEPSFSIVGAHAIIFDIVLFSELLLSLGVTSAAEAAAKLWVGDSASSSGFTGTALGIGGG